MLDKPRFAAPCNNCGKCCETQLCVVGVSAFGQKQPAPCPALTKEKLCGFVVFEQQTGMEPLVAQSLGIGAGCSMPDATTTDAEIAAFDRISAVKVRHRDNGQPKQLKTKRTIK